MAKFGHDISVTCERVLGSGVFRRMSWKFLTVEARLIVWSYNKFYFLAPET